MARSVTGSLAAGGVAHAAMWVRPSQLAASAMVEFGPIVRATTESPRPPPEAAAPPTAPPPARGAAGAGRPTRPHRSTP
jgi:hypothetical protein